MKKLVLSVALCAAAMSVMAQSNFTPMSVTSMAVASTPDDDDEDEVSELEGKTAPNFTLMDINGRQLSLSQFRGKWVVLDFWGTWCGWCVKGIPTMKKYYARYKDKLQIIGIDCEESKDDWKAGVQEYELPWANVYSTGEGAGDPQVSYQVNAYPTKVIISPNGVVKKVVEGENEEFYKYLDSVLK